VSVHSSPSSDGAVLTINISERFDFNVHAQLRAAYRNTEKRYTEYVIDLRDTIYMDSSALGMLLQIKEHAGGSAQSVRIRNAAPGIKDILRVANFDKLMTIE
jgi:anti-anti-sigma factor